MVRDYILARARESSTWRGIILFASSLGYAVDPSKQEAIIAAGIALAGLIGVFFPDGGRRD